MGFSYTSDMCPETTFRETTFRHGKAMADFQACFFAKLLPMARLFGVAALALGLLLAQQQVGVSFITRQFMPLDKGQVLAKDTLCAGEGCHGEAPHTAAAAATFPFANAAFLACIITMWAARAYFQSRNGQGMKATQLVDIFLDKVLRPATGVAGIVVVSRWLVRLASVHGMVVVSYPLLPAATLAQMLCGSAWALATWSALIYIAFGFQKDAAARRRHGDEAPSPPVTYNIVEGKEVDPEATAAAAAVPILAAGAGAATGAVPDAAAAKPAFLAAYSEHHLDLSADEEEGGDAQEGAEEELEEAVAAKEGTAEHHGAGDHAEDCEQESRKSQDRHTVDAMGSADVVAKAVRRRERKARIGSAISRILNGTSAGVLGRRHLLRGPRGGDEGERNGAGRCTPAPPSPSSSPPLVSTFAASAKPSSNTSPFTMKKKKTTSKFRRVMSEIFTISNAGFIRRSSSSANEDEAGDAAAEDDCAFGASSSPDSDGNPKAVGTFSKMLRATLNASASGLIAAKRRYSRRSVS